MAKNSSTADGTIWRRVHRLVRSLLPVPNPDELLVALARGWRELVPVDAVFVWTQSPDALRVLGVLSEKGRSPRTFELETSVSGTGPAPQIAQTLLERAEVRLTADQQVADIPFRHEGQIVGGTLLFSQIARPQDRRFLNELGDLTARLLVQARQANDIPSTHAEAAGAPAAKLEALAEFAAGAGHEINNPVATIAGRAGLLLRNETDPERRDALTTIVAQAYRIRDMIGDAMLFGRPPRPAPERLNLPDVLQAVVAKMSEAAQTRGCSLQLSAETDVPIWADPVQLSVVLSSLIQNGLDAIPGGQTIDICARAQAGGAVKRAFFSVLDRGPGLSDEEREHLFDPFYSGRQAGRGLGFGLPKCWRIITNHGGRIEVESKPDCETTFRVYWPADEPCETVGSRMSPDA